MFSLTALILLLITLAALALVYYLLVEYVVDRNSRVGQIVTFIFILIGVLDVLHFFGVY